MENKLVHAIAQLVYILSIQAILFPCLIAQIHHIFLSSQSNSMVYVVSIYVGIK